MLKLGTQLLEELKTTLLHQKPKAHSQPVQKIDVVAAIQVHLEQLTAQEQLDKMGADILKTYSAVFVPCPHTDDLPTDVYCCIELKDTLKTITTRSYSSPCKY